MSNLSALRETEAEGVPSAPQPRARPVQQQRTAERPTAVPMIAKDTIELMNKSPQNFERLVLIRMDSYDSESRIFWF